MSTNFTSVGIKNTLIVGGTATIATLIATAVTLTTATITTANITTANTTTENVQTLSGTTINALQAGSIINARTISGATINALQANGVVKARTLSGAIIKYGGGTALGILCKKTDGTIGTVVRSATGTIVAGACT